MYESFILLETNGKPREGKRVYLDQLRGRDERWLRDTLFRYPRILPINEIDSTFGPLIPLCKEMQTDAGRIDAVFINEHGRLTIVECKRWKNPQSRREVVSQTLDYVRALFSWTYSDLQRQVSAATGKKGNLPYEVVKGSTKKNFDERDFVDSVSRSLREGRFLVLISGDGIREGLQSLTELVNRNATKAFSFGVVEVALYQFENGQLAIQPRVLLETEVITRSVTVINTQGSGDSVSVFDGEHDGDNAERPSGSRLHLKAWWRPVLSMKFDDPEQEPPYWAVTNNVVLNTPFPGIQIKAFAVVGGPLAGIFVGGTRKENTAAIRAFIRREKSALREALPADTYINSNDEKPISYSVDNLSSDEDRREFIIKNLNLFVNVLRPRLAKWYAEFAK